MQESSAWFLVKSKQCFEDFTIPGNKWLNTFTDKEEYRSTSRLKRGLNLHAAHSRALVLSASPRTFLTRVHLPEWAAVR